MGRKVKEVFYECVSNFYIDNKREYEKFFQHFKVQDLKLELMKVSHTKYFDGLFLSFDCSTEFHFEVYSNVFAYDIDGDEEQLAHYRLILNSNFDIVDDFLTGF